MKKVKQDERHVIVVLDESGSMASRKSDTVNGLNEFIQTQKKESPGLVFTLTLFSSSKLEQKYKKISIKDIDGFKDEEFCPNNFTPLWDAVGRTIAAVPESDKGVMFVILTDGEENASREFKAEQVRNLIKEKEKLGWKFIYLGVDLDKFVNDAHLAGFTAGVVDLNAGTGSTGVVGVSGAAGYRGAMGDLGQTVSNYVRTGNVAWGEEDKKDANK